MTTRRQFIAAIGAGLVVCNLGLAQEPTIAGVWTGVLELGSQRLRLKLIIAADGSATLYSLDQDNTPIPAKVTSMNPEEVRIEVHTAKRSRFTGHAVSADRIEGIWHQVGDVPLVLLRGEAGLLMPAPQYEPLTQPALDSLWIESGAPALAAAAARRGKTAKKWASGERSTGSEVATTVNDVWHLGSNTKSMTATLVARLVESSAISWDDTAGNLLKYSIPDMQAAYRPVSFRHLLCHRAGLPGDLPLLQFAKFMLRDVDDTIGDRRAYARAALRMEPVGPKESTFKYANNGYVVAAAMLEAKLNQPWEDLMRRHVFEPLKLASAGFGPPGQPGVLLQPVGHLYDADSRLLNLLGGNFLKPEPPGKRQADNPQALGPAGRVHMGLDDILTYLAAHRDRVPLLKPESWRILHTPPFGGTYAMGWIKRPDGSFWHNGSNNRWYAEVIFNPSSGIVAAAATNEARTKASRAVGEALLRATQSV